MVEQKEYSTSFDTAFLVFSTLKRLGAGSVETFEERIKAQKIQYLAQVFRVSAPYGYSLYLHGPYSPDLTKDLYALDSKKIAPSTDRYLSDAVEERIVELQSFLKGKSTRQLEVITTLHWLVKSAKLSLADAIKKLEQLKATTHAEVELAKQSLGVLSRYD